MSSEPVVPTFILQRDGLFREGLRLILSGTRFHPHECGIDLDDLSEVPRDRSVLFIIGVGASQAVICSEIRDQYPLAFVVAVADESDPASLASALGDGANAALFSSVSPDALVSTLQAVINERLILIDSRLWSLEMQQRAEDRPPASAPNEISLETTDELQATKLLSSREIAILERIVRGDSNKHVARFFNIAEPTVKAHVKAILRKLGANNRTQAAIWAVNNKIFDDTYDAANLPILINSDTAAE
jgi:two-component system, NarL family, nitrate/nitrite response regulator NarL